MANESLSACLAEIKANPGKFYVYILSRPDGTPFYVGMGRRDRIAGHEREARRKVKSRKVNIIRSITSAGGVVMHSIRAWFDDRESALGFERALISEIGRLDCGLGPLANATDGGDGGSGRIDPPEVRERRAAAHRGKPKSEAHKLALSDACRNNPKVMAANAKSVAVCRGSKRPDISAMKKGVKLSAEHARKIAESRAKSLAVVTGYIVGGLKRRGTKKSDETKAKIRAAAIARCADVRWQEIQARPRPNQSEAMKAKWADPEFRRLQTDRLAAANRRRHGTSTS